MTITCPLCEASLTLKGLKPGSYSPKCPKCRKPFVLVLAENDDDELIIEKLEATALPTTVAVPMLKRQPEDQDTEDEEDSDESPDTEDEEEDSDQPLPKTKPYPMVRKHQQPPDDEEGDITDVEQEEPPKKPGAKPLPKTQSYPMIKRKPPQDEPE